MRLATLLAGLIAFAAAALPAIAATSSANGLIVKLKDATPHNAASGSARHPDAARWQRVLRDAGMSPQRFRATGRAEQVLDFGHRLSPEEAEQMAAALRLRPDVEWVAPNVRERRLQTPNDPFFPAPQSGLGQWWLFPNGGSNANVIGDRRRGVPGFQAAWSRSTGLPSAVVAVLDTGVTAHPELAGQTLPGYDFISDVDFANDGDGRDADPSDPGDWVSSADLANPAFGGCEVENSSWHGTVISGQIAALTDNGVGVAAMNWAGRVLPVRVAGKCGADVADIVDGMRWAAGLPVPGLPRNANPARVISISFGGTGNCAPYQAAIDELLTIGVVVVAAAGNEHGSTLTRPGKCPGAIGVVALNRDGFKASYSNFSTTATIATVGGDPVDDGAWGRFVGEPGLLSLDNLGRTVPGQPAFSYVAGTSFSTPVVAGAISLMLSVNPTLTADQIVQGLRASARPHVVSPTIGKCSNANPGRCICTVSTCGAGILDVDQALAFAAQPTTYVAPPRTPAVIDNADIDAAVAVGPDLPPNAAPSGDSGGGAMSAGWLAGLMLAGVLLMLTARRRA